MSKTTNISAQTDVIANALASRRPRRPQRMPREAAAPAELPTADTSPDVPAAARPESKIARVISLLKREDGATLEELVEATGWLPHTMRAALTGLRKKGHLIDKTKRGEVTCYRIEQGA